MSKNINSEIVELMFQISRSMKERMVFSSTAANLTLLQLLTLGFIKKSQKAVQMKDIADYLSIEMPTATSLLNKLFRLNLVNRVVDKEDRRIVRINLTKKGDTLVDEAMKRHGERIEKMLSYLDTKQKEDFYEILKILSNKLS